MSAHNASPSSDYRVASATSDDDAVDTTVGVPTDRVRWGPIVAGTFAALTALAILGTLGIAIGLSSYDPGHDSPRNFAMGYGFWGIISTILAFAFGGLLTARVAALHGRSTGMLNGMMVAAFGLPLLMFLIGSAGTFMGQAEVASSRDMPTRGISDGSAVTASATVAPDNTSSSATGSLNDREQVRRIASRTAWATLTTLVLALGAATAGGYLGSRTILDDRDLRGRVAHA